MFLMSPFFMCIHVLLPSQDLVQRADVKQVVVQQLRATGKAGKLKGFEVRGAPAAVA